MLKLRWLENRRWIRKLSSIIFSHGFPMLPAPVRGWLWPVFSCSSDWLIDHFSSFNTLADSLDPLAQMERARYSRSDNITVITLAFFPTLLSILSYKLFGSSSDPARVFAKTTVEEDYIRYEAKGLPIAWTSGPSYALFNIHASLLL